MRVLASVSPEKLKDSANAAEQLAISIQDEGAQRAIEKAKADGWDSYVRAHSEPAPWALPIYLEQLWELVRNQGPSLVHGADYAQIEALSNASHGIRLDDVRLLRDALEALKPSGLDQLFPEGLLSSVEASLALPDVDPASRYVVGHVDLLEMTLLNLRAPRPHEALLQMRLSAARGLAVERNAPLLDIDGDVTAYAARRARAEQALKFPIPEEFIIQDESVIDQLANVAKLDLHMSETNRRAKILHVMLERLIPHDQDGRLRWQMAVDHVKILNLYREIPAEVPERATSGRWTLDRLLDLTAHSFLRDDLFFIRRFMPAFRAMRFTNWTDLQIATMMNLLRGLEPERLGDDVRSDALETLKLLVPDKPLVVGQERGPSFDEVFAHLASTYARDVRFDGWPGWQPA